MSSASGYQIAASTRLHLLRQFVTRFVRFVLRLFTMRQTSHSSFPGPHLSLVTTLSAIWSLNSNSLEDVGTKKVSTAYKPLPVLLTTRCTERLTSILLHSRSSLADGLSFILKKQALAWFLPLCRVDFNYLFRPELQQLCDLKHHVSCSCFCAREEVI